MQEDQNEAMVIFLNRANIKEIASLPAIGSNILVIGDINPKESLEWPNLCFFVLFHVFFCFLGCSKFNLLS